MSLFWVAMDHLLHELANVGVLNVVECLEHFIAACLVLEEVAILKQVLILLEPEFSNDAAHREDVHLGLGVAHLGFLILLGRRRVGRAAKSLGRQVARSMEPCRGIEEVAESTIVLIRQIQGFVRKRMVRNEDPVPTCEHHVFALEVTVEETPLLRLLQIHQQLIRNPLLFNLGQKGQRTQTRTQAAVEILSNSLDRLVCLHYQLVRAHMRCRRLFQTYSQ